MKSKKVIWFVIGVIIILAISVFGVYKSGLLDDLINEDYVIKINNEGINEEEFSIYLNMQKKYIEDMSEDEINWNEVYEEEGVPFIDFAKKNAVDVIKDTKVKLQEAKRRGLNLTKDEEKQLEQEIIKSANNLNSYGLTNEQGMVIFRAQKIIEKLALEEDIKNDFDAISKEWIDSAKVEYGDKYYLIGVEKT